MRSVYKMGRSVLVLTLLKLLTILSTGAADSIRDGTV